MRQTQWLARTLRWIIFRGPQFVIMRLTMQVFRQVTGRPVYRYSKVVDGLYVGGQYRRRGWRSMQANGINSVVNLRRRGALNWDAGPSYYLHLPTPDNTPPTLEAIVAGVAFIQARITEGDRVYVHCGVGVGRAPTLAAAYLVSTGMTPDEAWRQLRKVRPFIFPFKAQVDQVRAFANMLENGDRNN